MLPVSRLCIAVTSMKGLVHAMIQYACNTAVMVYVDERNEWRSWLMIIRISGIRRR